MVLYFVYLIHGPIPIQAAHSILRFLTMSPEFLARIKSYWINLHGDEIVDGMGLD